MPAWPPGIASVGLLDDAQGPSRFQGAADTADRCGAVGCQRFRAYKCIPSVPVHIIDQPHEDDLVTRVQSHVTGHEIATPVAVNVYFSRRLALISRCVHIRFHSSRIARKGGPYGEAGAARLVKAGAASVVFK
jgi:hypothetical protein